MPAQSLPIAINPTYVDPYPTVSLRLTTICAPSGESYLWNTGGGAQQISGLTLRDCEVYGSGALWQMSENYTPGPFVGLTNNVFYRVPFAINSGATITSFNNLFYGTTNANVTNTTVSIQYLSGYPSPNTNENNVFDGVTVALDGSNYNQNAYLHGAVNTNSTTNSTDLFTSLFWDEGPLGNYYQGTASPLLNNGSTNASSLGLYHYTVSPNSDEVEGSNTVSRGYHYVGVGADGLPLDSNNDGLPDYLQDTNGSGTNDAANPWNENTAPWIGTQPLNQYAVLGTPATFSVMAYGSPPLTYQWYFNGAAIDPATSSTYTIPAIAINDAGTFTVTVKSNYSSGSTNSANATLTIVIPPQVSNIAPSTNGTYWLQPNFEALSLVVTNAFYGSATPQYYSQYLNPYLYYESSYQWQFNGTNIPSASGTGSNIAYIPTFDGGTNSVVITNQAGSTNVTWTNVFIAAPGMVEEWGANGSGACNRPANLTNVAAIATGPFQSIAVTVRGTVAQCGQYNDTNGGIYYSVTDTSVATQPPASGVVAVAGGIGQGLALTTSNTVIAWGLTDSPAATIPPGVPTNNVTAIACGSQFDVELLSNGTVVAWGNNSDNQTNVPANLTNVIAIASYAEHSL